jgi:hypothetical protein
MANRGDVEVLTFRAGSFRTRGPPRVDTGKHRPCLERRLAGKASAECRPSGGTGFRIAGCIKRGSEGPRLHRRPQVGQA